MIRPLTRIASPLPFLPVTNWASPIVPPAPEMFWTWTPKARPAVCRASCMARAVWSQPPPGLAGAMISSPSTWACAGAAASARVVAAAMAMAINMRRSNLI